MKNMTTTSIQVSVVDSPDDACVYGKDVTLLKAIKALIIKNGTISNKATVDLQVEDIDGNKFVVMTTGNLLSTLSSAVQGAQESD